LAAILSCGWLMTQLPKVTWVRFILWLAIGLLIYFPYGLRRSRLQKLHGAV
jgi:APA family basic amino acid/polyamine antiporter